MVVFVCVLFPLSVFSFLQLTTVLPCSWSYRLSLSSAMKLSGVQETLVRSVHCQALCVCYGRSLLVAGILPLPLILLLLQVYSGRSLKITAKVLLFDCKADVTFSLSGQLTGITVPEQPLFCGQLRMTSSVANTASAHVFLFRCSYTDYFPYVGQI